ncbi:MAG TPA: redox-sensing transcriptional repressor Rex [Dehalococcoidia bacterium]|nr:redox-sensing transcriptional repressor Rex [Dehalococcoidia bacterium]
MINDIPEVVILRLPLYARVLASLEGQGVEVVSSQTLGTLLQATPAQIRKDLSYFGRFGKQGRGYRVSGLLRELRQILGLERQWSAVLVGVGHLGRAVLSYDGFAPQGFHVVAAFDTDPAKVGTQVAGVPIQDIGELEAVTREKTIDIGIVAVPGEHCQQVVDLLVTKGIKAILNYAPYQPRVPKGVWIRDIDPVVALQSMTFHLKSLEGPRPEPPRGRRRELAASS